MNTIESIHRETWDLIPWMVNQSASPDQRRRAEKHLQSCADCREEFALQSRIHEGMNLQPQGDMVAAGAALQALLHRIDAGVAMPAHSASSHGHARATSANALAAGVAPRRRRRLLVGLAAAVVLQAIGLVALGTLVLESRSRSEHSGGYATLSADEPHAADATIRLVPSPTLALGGLQRLLDEAGLQIVGSNRGATILALAPAAPTTRNSTAGTNPDARTRETIAQLRSSPDILLAEPILSPANSR